MAFGKLGAPGRGFGSLGAIGGAGGSTGPTPGTPVLVWTSATTDLTPDGTVTFDNVPVAGDTITSQIQAAGGDWSTLVLNDSHVITADEDLVNEADLANSDLPAGSYDWRVRITHNSAPSGWSNVETKTLTSFTPAALSPQLWLEPAQGGMFQSNAGSGTGAAANSDPIGYLPDLSGSGFHVTSAANDTTRPTLDGVGVKPYVNFASASSQYLRRAASLGSYAAGTFTWAVVVRGNSAANSSRVIAEGNNSQNNTVLDCLGVVSTSSATALWRQDSGTGPANNPNGSSIPLVTNVFDGNDHVWLVEYNAATTTINFYKDGTLAQTMSSATTGTFTLNQFAIGALWRTTAASFFSGRVYGVVCKNAILSSGDRSSLTTYLGNLAGLTL